MSDHADHAVAGDPGRRILPASRIDQIGEALLALTGEVWMLTDRMAVLEAVLAGHGIDAQAEIDRFVPTAAMEAALNAKRDRLIGAVLAPLKAAPPQP